MKKSLVFVSYETLQELGLSESREKQEGINTYKYIRGGCQEGDAQQQDEE